MTSKLKCPFCQQELGVILCDPDDFICPKCRLCGTESLWQALIQAKQDLEIARQALEGIAELALAHNDISIADEVVGVFDALNQQDFADKIREQIEHKVDYNE